MVSLLRVIMGMVGDKNVIVEHNKNGLLVRNKNVIVEVTKFGDKQNSINLNLSKHPHKNVKL